MPIFRVTKKLAIALHVKLPKGPVESANPEHEWFADLFYVEGKKCVVWVHRTTLLMFVRPAVVAAELKQFPALFGFEFGALMASMALPESLLDRFGGHGPATYAPTNDRAIVGSMLDGRKMFALIVDLDDGLQHADVRSINAQLNEVPMSVLKMESAVTMVRRLVDQGPMKLH